MIYFPFLITVGKNNINYIPSLKVKAGVIQSCVHSVVSPPLPKKEEEKKQRFIYLTCVYTRTKAALKAILVTKIAIHVPVCLVLIAKLYCN